MRLAISGKNSIFSSKLANFTPKSGFLPDFPVYTGSKITKKIMKNDDEVSGFLTIFWVKSQYMGPQKSPKTTKNRDFWPFPTPPKIIKNRLNFAHSEICEKSDFNPNFDVKIITRFKQLKPRCIAKRTLFSYIHLPPPPKIIKNRLNFAHSEKCEKSRFLLNFVEIKLLHRNTIYLINKNLLFYLIKNIYLKPRIYVYTHPRKCLILRSYKDFIKRLGTDAVAVYGFRPKFAQ